MKYLHSQQKKKSPADVTSFLETLLRRNSIRLNIWPPLDKKKKKKKNQKRRRLMIGFWGEALKEKCPFQGNGTKDMRSRAEREEKKDEEVKDDAFF